MARFVPDFSHIQRARPTLHSEQSPLPHKRTWRRPLPARSLTRRAIVGKSRPTPKPSANEQGPLSVPFKGTDGEPILLVDLNCAWSVSSEHQSGPCSLAGLTWLEAGAVRALLVGDYSCGAKRVINFNCGSHMFNFIPRMEVLLCQSGPCSLDVFCLEHKKHL